MFHTKMAKLIVIALLVLSASETTTSSLPFSPSSLPTAVRSSSSLHLVTANSDYDDDGSMSKINASACPICPDGSTTPVPDKYYWPESNYTCGTFPVANFLEANWACTTIQYQMGMGECACSAVCGLCKSGEVLNDDQLDEVAVGGDTCYSWMVWAATMKPEQAVVACPAVQALVGERACGCSSSQKNETGDDNIKNVGYCPLCADGSFVPSNHSYSPWFQNTILSDSLTCERMQLAAAIEQTEESLDCNVWQGYGLQCGCPFPAEESSTCSLCEDGSSVPFPDQVLSTKDNKTCSDMELLMAFRSDNDTCRTLQATVGVACHCRNPIASARVCRICGSYLLPDPTAVAYVENSTQKPMLCGNLEASAIGQLNESVCSAWQDEYYDVCGCVNATRLNPVSSPTVPPSTMTPSSLTPTTTVVVPEPSTVRPTIAPDSFHKNPLENEGTLVPTAIVIRSSASSEMLVLGFAIGYVLGLTLMDCILSTLMK